MRSSHVPELASHAGLIQALAVRLAGPEDADDVAQDAWVSALRRPPRRPGPVGPWLVGVVRNAARMVRRGRGRRVVHEARAPASREAVSPPTALERAEVVERVGRAVRRLPGPYAEAVLLRFYEGLPPREIARRLGIPVETVRTRVKRALHMLRADLDATWQGGRAMWLPLLANAASAYRPVPLSATALSTTGIVVMNKVKAATFALIGTGLLGGGVYLAADLMSGSGSHAGERDEALAVGLDDPLGELALDEGAPGGALEAREDGVRVRAEDPGSPAAGDGQGARAGTDAAADAAEAAFLDPYRQKTGADVVAGVVFMDEQPVEGGRLLVCLPGRVKKSWPLQVEDEDVHEVVIGRDGHYAMERPAKDGRRVLFIQVEVPGREPRRIEEQLWDLDTDRRFIRFGSASISGVVRDADGVAVPFSEVQCAYEGAGADGVPMSTLTRTDAAGAYTVAGLAPGAYRLRAKMPAGPEGPRGAREARTTLAKGAKRELDIGGVRENASFSGTVRLPSGQPVSGPGRLLFKPEGDVGEAFSIAYDVAGRFDSPVRAGTYRIAIQVPGLHALEAVSLPESFALGTEPVQQDLELDRMRITGTLRDAATGEVIVAEGMRFQWKEKGHSYPAAFHHVAVQRGDYVIDGLHPGRTYELSVVGRGLVVEGKPVPMYPVEVAKGATFLRVDLEVRMPR